MNPTVKSSAQKENELAREIRAAQATSNRPTLRERLESGVRNVIRGTQAYGGTRRCPYTGRIIRD